MVCGMKVEQTAAAHLLGLNTCTTTVYTQPQSFGCSMSVLLRTGSGAVPEHMGCQLLPVNFRMKLACCFAYLLVSTWIGFDAFD